MSIRAYMFHIPWEIYMIPACGLCSWTPEWDEHNHSIDIRVPTDSIQSQSILTISIHLILNLKIYRAL
jgi:hypothetical protein